MTSSETSVHGPSSGADDPLGLLDGLIGDWTSEGSPAPGGPAVSRSISYHWLFGRKFVRAESERRSGDALVRMEITYFWDSSTRAIKAWILASDGSWSQADVDVADGVVILHTKSVGPDGTVGTMTSTLRTADDGARTETWSNVRIGERSLPDAHPILWRRK